MPAITHVSLKSCCAYILLHRNIVGATYMLGMLVGSFALGYVSDKYGRYGDTQRYHGVLTIWFVELNLVCSSVCTILLGRSKIGQRVDKIAKHPNIS